MPAASCRIMPARSIRRCETISASFGFSFRMGRKNRDNRMGKAQGNQRGHERDAVKPDRVRKHKAGSYEKAAGNPDFRSFWSKDCGGAKAVAPRDPAPESAPRFPTCSFDQDRRFHAELVGIGDRNAKAEHP